MPGYRLLAVDIDGTLVSREDELSQATRAALERAGRAGIRIVLATGRRYRRVLPLVEPLGSVLLWTVPPPTILSTMRTLSKRSAE